MQEVSGVYTSPFLHRDERKMASRARKLSGAFEKRAPGVICGLSLLVLYSAPPQKPPFNLI